MALQYTEDILGDGFEQANIPLNDDFGGKVKATLVRKLSKLNTDKAILYIHGFNDYFFQSEMANQFNMNGYHFYAVDLRRYGRSRTPEQTPCDIRDLTSYFEEIDKSIDCIRAEQSNSITLIGHSTGGLIAALYAKNNTGKGRFDNLILNSPFFDFNLRSKLLETLLPLASSIGRIIPNFKISGTISKYYGESLHKDYYGEWSYNLKWKPNMAYSVTLGWIHAIRSGHLKLKEPFRIDEPVLIMHSDKTASDVTDLNQASNSDMVLSIQDIDRISQNIVGDLVLIPIRDGLHDLTLSKKEVRYSVYDEIFNWLAMKG